MSEAQSELDRQELRIQCADRTLHESGIQLRFQRMELQLNQSYDHSFREKNWLCTESERRDKSLQEHRIKKL